MTRQADERLPTEVDRVRTRLRGLRADDVAGWLQGCDFEIQAAQRQGDGARVAELCLLAASRLDAVGRLEDALARIDFGLKATQEPARHAQLWFLRANLMAMSGDLPAARLAMSLAERSQTGPQLGRDRIEAATYRSVLASIAIEEASIAQAHQTVAEAQHAGFDWLASGLVTWLVPWLAARGLASAALPWVDWLEAQSAAVAHRLRGEDAAAFRYAIALTGVGGRASHFAPRVASKFAIWRVMLAQLRRAVLRGEVARSRRLVLALQAHVGGMNPGFQDGHNGFRALVEAYAGVDLASVPAPHALTLVTLPAWLAGAEAAALAATRAEASRWRVLLDASLPARVVTSLEWPVGLSRVRALLALREGDVRDASVQFEAAVAEAGARHAPLERALAVMQWRELAATGLAPANVPARATVDAARDVLAGFRVPAVLHAHAAARALASGVAQPRGPRLTARELEVLAGLEAGESYREIAARLGVGWRTVQTHAHRTYTKLEVPGRRAAIEAARARRLI